MNSGDLSDAELIICIANADEDAFRLLYERNSKRIFSFILRFTGNHHEAEEILQETFLRVFRKASSYKPRAAVTTWIFQIAMNLCRDRGRRLPRKEVRLEDTFEPGIDASPLDDAAESESKKIVSEVIEMLPKNERSVFLLRVYEKLQYEKIAEIVGCSERTARERMKRARVYFLEELQRWDTALSEVLSHGLS